MLFFCGRGSAEGVEEVPDGYAGGDADVEGVFGAELGDFEAEVGGVDYLRVYSVDFVAGYDGVASGGVGAEVGEGYGAFDLFEGADGVAVGAE